MGFLAPWFLAGAAAAGIPIWLHLLRRHRTDPQPFSSLMFFERRIETSVQPKRLRYLLLLALRVAILLLLALAFANPFLDRQRALAGRKGLVVIAVDRSFSMRAANRMELARERARAALSQVRGNTPVQLVAVDSGMETLVPATTDRGALESAIATIQPTDLRGSYAELVRGLHNLQQNTRAALDVHLITDAQQTAMPPAFADLQLGPNIALTLEPAAGKPAANWAVESLTATAEIYDPKITRVSAVVAGWQTEPSKRKITLVIDGHVVASKELDIAANGRAPVEFTGFNVSYGSHRGEIRMEPHDQLPADDAMNFSMERSDPRPVLFLTNGRPRDSFYYKAAMDAAGNTGLLVQPLNAQQAENVELSRYAFVVLSDVAPVTPAMERRLDNYVRRRGSLLVLAGPATAREGRIPLSGCKVSASTVTQAAGYVDNAHPALAGLGALPNVDFYVTAKFEPVPGERILAKLGDGSPLLAEHRMGEGRVLILGVTFDNSTTDFPIHRSFVPFVAQSARYLAGMEDLPSAIVTGEPVELRRSREGGAAASDVIGPDGRHELSLREAATAQYFVPRQEGFYEVHRADGRRMLLGVHADRLESDLTPVAEETLTLWKNTGGTGAADPQTIGAESRTYQETFWRTLLLFGLLVAVTESLFASRYLKEERSRQDGARTTERLFAKT